MKRFKQYLNEGSSSSVQDMIFQRTEDEVIIPLSQPMWERLTGEKSTIYGVHITDADGLHKLSRMQRSRKQVSVMTELGDSEIQKFLRTEYGILSDGGVWTVLKGTPVIEFNRDFGTQRDSQGRRWIDLTYKIHDESLLNTLQGLIAELKENIYEHVILRQDDNPELQKEMGSFDPDDPDRWRSDAVYPDFNFIPDQGTGKEKALAIKMYIDGIEEIVRQNLDGIMRSIEELDFATQEGFGWNESVLTNFVIEFIYIEPRMAIQIDPYKSEPNASEISQIKRRFGAKKVKILTRNLYESSLTIQELFNFVKTTKGWRKR